MMEKILQKYKIITHCDHCNNEFDTVWLCKMESVIGTRYALLCSGCQKLIGIYSSNDSNIPVTDSHFTFDKMHNSLN
jgi:hypothetical protein